MLSMFGGSRDRRRGYDDCREEEVVDPTSASRVQTAISTAVVAAVEDAVRKAGGSTVIIGHLEVKVQINAASGGGATVTVANK